jgi:hypothetical protein
VPLVGDKDITSGNLVGAPSRLKRKSQDNLLDAEGSAGGMALWTTINPAGAAPTSVSSAGRDGGSCGPLRGKGKRRSFPVLLRS